MTFSFACLTDSGRPATLIWGSVKLNELLFGASYYKLCTSHVRTWKKDTIINLQTKLRKPMNYIVIVWSLFRISLQVPTSQENQRNQITEFSWGCIISFVVCNLCLGTYQINPYSSNRYVFQYNENVSSAIEQNYITP